MKSSNHEKQVPLYTAGIVWMLSGVALGTTDGADVDYGREWNTYVTLRGGWLFGGGVEGNYTVSTHTENNRNWKKNIKSALSGSGSSECRISMSEFSSD